MTMEIFIPTLGRSENQITYNQLPDAFKKNVTMVVQEHEFQQYTSRYDVKIMVVPDNIGIAKTRELIYNGNKDKKFAMFDDDIRFLKRNPGYVEQGTKSKEPLNEQDYWLMFKYFSGVLKMFPFAGMKSAGLPPGRDPAQIAGGVFATLFFNGPLLPKLDWSLKYGEDIHMTLQLLGQGIPNIVSDVFVYSPLDPAGGCKLAGRTVEEINECHQKLVDLYPGTVTFTGVKSPEGYNKIKIMYNRHYKNARKGLTTKLNFDTMDA